MADDALNSTPQLSSSVQNVVDRFAQDAVRGIRLINHFKDDKTRVGETTIEILRFSAKDPDTGKFPEWSGYTLPQLLQLLRQIDEYFKESSSREYFEAEEHDEWTERQQEIEFGANLEARASFSEVNEALETASAILFFIINHSSNKLVLRAEIEETAPVAAAAAPTPASGDLTIPIVIPSNIRPSEEKKPEEKNDEKDKTEEEKEKEEERKKERGEKPRSVIQEIASGDAAFHREIVRMEVMLANQLAAFYGISEKAMPKFTQEFTQYIAPHLYFELQKLGPGAIKDALKSPKGRNNIYLSALLRMQHDPAFTARLTTFLNTTAQGKPQKKKEGRVVQPTAEEIAQTPQPLPKDIVAAIEKAGDQVTFTDTEVEQIGQMRATSTATLAQELRDLLGYKGAGLVDSDINNILIRLQAFAITRKNIHQLTQAQYQEVFGSVFGSVNPLVFQRIQRYFQQSQLDWTRAFSAYVESTRLDIFEKTHNPAVFSLNPDAQPSDLVVDGVHKTLFAYGPATAMSMYAPRPVLEQRKQELEATGGVALQSPEYKEITAALSLQNTTISTLKRIANLTAPQQEFLFSQLGYTQEIYQQLHITEVFAYIQAFQVEDAAPDAQFIGFIMPEEYLTASTEGGVYAPGEETAQWLQYAQMLPGVMGTPNEGGGYQVNQMDRALGKMALAVITGGESIVIVDKIEKIQGIIGAIPVFGEQINGFVDKYGWRSLDLIGKAIKWLFSLAGISALASLMGFVASLLVGLKYGAAIASALQGFASQVAMGIKSLIGKAAAFGTKLAGGIGHALGGLGASGIAGITSALGAAPFAGGAAIMGTMGVVFYSVFFSNNVGPAFLTNIDGSGTATNASYADGIGNRGCWPTSGTVYTLDTYTGDCVPSILNNYCKHLTTARCYRGLTGQNVCGVGPGATGQAIDISGNVGFSIYAPYPGKATFIPKTSNSCFKILKGLSWECAYGNHVFLSTTLGDKDVIFIFAHLSEFAEQYRGNPVDVPVSVGGFLGLVGSTGNSTGPHLHYEVLGTTRDSIIPERVAVGDAVVSSCSPDSQITL